MKGAGFVGQLFETICVYRKYDPATKSRLEILFLYPGIKAWFFHYIAHKLYKMQMPFFPRFLTEMGRLFSGIDIHPGAQIGRRVIMDHGAGIVIGETAEIGDDVILYQGVTLGGTSLDPVKRHPTVEAHCVLGAGAKILGAIRIGQGSRVGANSVVISDVPAGATVVGIPGRVVVSSAVKEGEELDHARLPDPVLARFRELEQRIDALESKATDF
jgi:serine O-acetyltransferase